MSPDIQSEICRRLIEGESLAAICRDKDMPAQGTVYLRLQKDEAFRKEYREARELQADALADQTLDIANTPILGTKTTTKADGTVETVEADMIEHRRLMVDTRKWLAGKLRPKKYGEATLLKHADSEGQKIEMDDHQRAVRLAAMMHEIASRGGQDR